MATDNPAERVTDAVELQGKRHSELVALCKIILREGEGTTWASIRRTLRLAGYGNGYETRSHALSVAILEAFPNAHFDREYIGYQRPRFVHGVTLVVTAKQLRDSLIRRWEKKMHDEGMPAELKRIADEYTGGIALEDSLPANDNANGRLIELARRTRWRKRDAGTYYEIALDYYHQCNWSNYAPRHKEIWGLHCAGETKREIAAAMRMPGSTIQATLDKHRARAGILHR